jgi:glycosyltransferase involved in cell wall biosynthesis
VVIGQVARLVPFKGQKTLLLAAKSVLQRQPDAFFLLVGFAPKFSRFDQELVDEAKRLGIDDRVCICGYGGSVADVWKLIDLHVHASHFDSLPNAILEGMSLGKPAVVTDVGGIPELVTHGRTGLVVRAQDASALADGLVQLIEDPLYAGKLGAAAQQRYEERCRPERVAAEIEALFRKLVRRKRNTVTSEARSSSALSHGANH